VATTSRQNVSSAERHRGASAWSSAGSAPGSAPEEAEFLRGSATMPLRYSHGCLEPRISPRGRQPGPPARGAQRGHGRPGPQRVGAPPRLRRGARDPAAPRCRGGERGGARAGPAGQRAPPRADVLRPLRQPDRRGRVPPVLALADGARRRPRPGRGGLGATGRRRPRRTPAPGRRVPGVVAHRAGARLPDLDDVRRDPGPAGRRRAGQGVDAGAGVHDVRPRAAAGRGQARRAVRHGHDREAGRLRRPRDRHRGTAHRHRRGVHPARPR
jgi:hypothetical protein